MKFNLLFKVISLFILNACLFTRAESINECNEVKENWGDFISQCKNDDAGKAYYLIVKYGITQDLIDKISTFSELKTISFVYVPIDDELNFRPFRKNTKLNSVCFDNEKTGPYRLDYEPYRVRNKVIKYFPNLTLISFYHVIIGKSALDEIGTLTKLTSIEFHKTTFDDDATFHSFKSLTNLTRLQIEAYKKTLKRVSTSLNYLTNLVNLEIRADGADFAFLSHPTLENLKSLKYLDVTNDIGLDLKYIGSLTNLVLLILDCSNAKSFPNNIGNLKNLKEITLFSSPIKTLPDSFGDLESLENIYLASNEIETIPESIGNLKNLRILNLGYNKIKEIPSSIGNLVNLEKLSLESNSIEVIPESIGNLKKLDNLSLSYNKIEVIPESIGNLENIVNLRLSNNNIQSIPDSIGNLQNLKYLYLNNNNITSIPDSLNNLSSIRELNLNNNPIKSE
ncbi:L domain-like protein [Anaeromyces robustus]|uniref:L domain-like protein n=1 Tax=Anaeromyces robustus TaxID=1754192 RepID=A0A1Y1VUF5_9FUNG|nr:L domain-like protein [Anaeromyces robustus]|eukprot:ORX64929.1 L domain-like protein [Anaeromyces robustus]